MIDGRLLLAGATTIAAAASSAGWGHGGAEEVWDPRAPWTQWGLSHLCRHSSSRVKAAGLGPWPGAGDGGV